MIISEEFFKLKFLEFFKFKKYTDEEFLAEQLNGEKIYYLNEEFQTFLYHFLKDNHLPLEICGTFPWTKYFKEGLWCIIEQTVRRLLGMKYDEYFFEDVEPFYYETLKNHLFSELEKINKNDYQFSKLTISEEFFKAEFLKSFYKLKSKNNKLSTIKLNYLDEYDLRLFFYCFLRDNNLPMKIHFNFPWHKYFKKDFLYGLKEHIKKWRGMKYDKEFFEPEEPFYYETLKNHLFNELEKIKDECP